MNANTLIEISTWVIVSCIILGAGLALSGVWLKRQERKLDKEETRQAGHALAGLVLLGVAARALSGRK